MFMLKKLALIGLGLGIAACGWLLSQSATKLAWPDRFVNTEMQKSTAWGTIERYYEIGGMVILGVGAAIVLVVFMGLVRQGLTTLFGRRPTTGAPAVDGPIPEA